MARQSYNRSVFINCPFDRGYDPLFKAAVFTVLRCNFFARCATERDDSSETRLHKIYEIIEESRFGIHDLSRVQLDKNLNLPRFNMPLELGIFLGAKRYGNKGQNRKDCLIFEKLPHSYEKFISDIKGQDIVAHRNSPETVVIRIRDWLASKSKKDGVWGGRAIWKDYQSFNLWLPEKCRKGRLNPKSLTFADFVNLVYSWIESRFAAVQKRTFHSTRLTHG